MFASERFAFEMLIESSLLNVLLFHFLDMGVDGPLVRSVSLRQKVLVQRPGQDERGRAAVQA